MIQQKSILQYQYKEVYYLETTFIKSTCSISNSGSTFQSRGHSGVMFPPLELSEWVYIWVLII